MKKSKTILAMVLTFASVLSMSGCQYEQPENSQRWQYNYDAVLKYAKTIDPNVTLNEYKKREIVENSCTYREYDAVIHGVKCHVTSVERRVYNHGLFVGLDLSRSYYLLDTDYGYYVLKDILEEEQPTWELQDFSYWDFYQQIPSIDIDMHVENSEELSDEELTALCNEARAIDERFSAYDTKRDLYFRIPVPCVVDGETKMYSLIINEFSEEALRYDFERYHKDWQEYRDELPQ